MPRSLLGIPVAATAATESLTGLRSAYKGYTPWNLAKVKGEDKLFEFTSYPWRDGDRVLIGARPIGDPSTMRVMECRREVTAVRWSAHRKRAYKDGFMAGFQYAVLESRRLAHERISEPARNGGWSNARP